VVVESLSAINKKLQANMLAYQCIGFFLSGQGEILKVGAFLKHILTDILFIISYISFLYGFWLIYEPLTYILGGICLFYVLLPLKKGK